MVLQFVKAGLWKPKEVPKLYSLVELHLRILLSCRSPQGLDFGVIRAGLEKVLLQYLALTFRVGTFWYLCWVFRVAVDIGKVLHSTSIRILASSRVAQALGSPFSQHPSGSLGTPVCSC